jgi:hypothetical protein
VGTDRPWDACCAPCEQPGPLTELAEAKDVIAASVSDHAEMSNGWFTTFNFLNLVESIGQGRLVCSRPLVLPLLFVVLCQWKLSAHLVTLLGLYL